MPRPSTRAESVASTVEATPEIAQAVRGWLAACAACSDAWEKLRRDTPGWTFQDHAAAVRARDEAWARLEDLILDAPLAWHVVDGRGWRKMKVGKGGFEIRSRALSELEPTGRQGHG